MDTFAQLSSDPPGVLFHYTDAQSLHSILSTQKLRATMLHYLNDAREFKYGFGLFLKELKEREATVKNEPHRALIAKYRERLPGFDGGNVCVFCLSANGDQLSQWRSYCPQSGGYSIGFQIETLRPVVDSYSGKSGGFRLTKCVYDLSTQKKIVGELWDKILAPALEQIDNHTTTVDEEIRSIKASMNEDVPFVAAAPKDPSFAEEKEWRIVTGCVSFFDDNMRFHARGSMIVPYIEVDLSGAAGWLARVFVGPSSGSGTAGPKRVSNCLQNSFAPYVQVHDPISTPLDWNARGFHCLLVH